MQYFHFEAPFGGVSLSFDKNRVISIVLAITSDGLESRLEDQTAIAALECYLSGQTSNLELPYSLSGTAFQKKVWQRLMTIPYGETQSYGQIAADLKTSPRSVGGACRRNPLPLIIPCHRVVGKDNVGGFMGGSSLSDLAGIKRKLLMHEQGLMHQ